MVLVSIFLIGAMENVNDDFNERTIPLLEAAGKDLQGARVGQSIDATALFAPRLGFNWDVNGEGTTQVRGGIGVFTSRLPLVWPRRYLQQQWCYWWIYV